MRYSKKKSEKSERIKLGKLHHICVAVNDVEEKAKSFSLFGIGPFEIGLFTSPSTKATLYGKPQGWSMKGGNAKLGSISIELQQTVQGRTLSNDFLAKKGEGIHHIAFECNPPFGEEIAKCERLGIRALQLDQSFEDPSYGWAYMDTEKLVGFVIELLCLPPEKRKSRAVILE
jgi:4-hydroxyphenylpyruvate dioxygenase-like putative hemolysin